MRRLLLLLALAACDSTSPAVARWPSARVEVGGMVFGLHWQGEEAEAYRLSGPARPFTSVVARATVALEETTGCKVDGIGGDAAILKARLACGSSGPRVPAVAVQPGDCAPGAVWRNDGLGTETTALECDLTVTVTD